MSKEKNEPKVVIRVTDGKVKRFSKVVNWTEHESSPELDINVPVEYTIETFASTKVNLPIKLKASGRPVGLWELVTKNLMDRKMKKELLRQAKANMRQLDNLTSEDKDRIRVAHAEYEDKRQHHGAVSNKTATKVTVDGEIVDSSKIDPKTLELIPEKDESAK